MKNPQKVDFNRLVDWIDGRLDEREAAEVAAQVAASNQETRAMVAWLQGFKQTSQNVTLLPPKEMRPSLVTRFEAWAAERREPSLLQQIVAALTFDSKLQTAAAVRSADVDVSPRQLIFSSPAADITLYIQPRSKNDRLDVSGQLFPQGDVEDMESAVFSIELQALDETKMTTMTTITDDLYEFSLPAVVPGHYNLTATSDQIAIHLEAFDIGL